MREAVEVLKRLAEIAAEANRSATLNSVTTAANGVR